MRNSLRITVVAIGYAFAVNVGQAADLGSAPPPPAQPAPDVSAGVGAFMGALLAPLDAATRPFDEAMRPVTGTQTSYSSSASTVPVSKRGGGTIVDSSQDPTQPKNSQLAQQPKS